MWPNPIRYAHALGLLPLVKEFRIRGTCDGPSSARFNNRILRQLSALSNVQKLEIERLNIPSFIPRVRQYFRDFLPTVQSLVLREPRGTHRQITYFIGLFQNLQDLGILYDPRHFAEEPDPALTPAFIPPLQGWLKLMCFSGAGILKNMIDFFGGIRFRYMDLYGVNGMGLLLDACAKTLECVVLDPTDCFGEQLSPKGMQVLANDFTAESSLQDFDLSRIESLRTLQIPWFSIDRASRNGSPNASRFLKHVLSTITSSAFSMIVVLYGDRNFCGVESEKAEEVSRHRRIFEVFREAHEVRGFRLKLCASAWGSAGEESARILEEAIAEERAENGFDDFLCDPFVGYNPRRSRFSRNAYVRGLSDFYSWVL